jgi:peptidoglycan/xylan/chitin deacetylase (PgdA/CDA1 family)
VNKTLADGFDEKLVEVFTLDGDAPLYKLPDGYVALTFDDGPSDYTKAIVDLLRERGVAGTFLFVGRNVGHYPEEAAYVAEHGMAVGNHSWDHSKLTKLGIDAISANIEQANQAIATITALPVSVFRPPYGATNDDVEIATEELGMKMLMWNRDPEDWKADTSDDIVRYFKQLSASGGIYVMHEKKATLDALPDIIDYLLEQKLKFAVFQ